MRDRELFSCSVSPAGLRAPKFVGGLASCAVVSVGGFHGMLLLSAKKNKICCLMGRHHMRGGSECHLTADRVIPLGAVVEYHPVSGKDLSRLHQFGPKVWPGIFFGYALHVGGESGKETCWSQTLKNWRRWTHLKSTPEGSM